MPYTSSSSSVSSKERTISSSSYHSTKIRSSAVDLHPSFVDIDLSYTNGMRVGVGSPISRSIYAPIPASFLPEPQVNTRYISGKGQGSPNQDRKAILGAFEREAKKYETELKELVMKQEELLLTGQLADHNDKGKGKESQFNTRPMEQARSRKKPMTVKDVRLALLNAMQGLAEVRGSEDDFYEEELGIRMDLVRKIDRRLEKRSKLEHDIEVIQNGDEERQMGELRQDLDRIEKSIQDQEVILRKLRSEKLDIKNKLSDISSVLSSRLSSYTSSLQALSTSTSSFLQSKNALLPQQKSKADMPLSPESAIEYWKTEMEGLQKGQKSVSEEFEALKDGLNMWEECLENIETYEDFMVKEFTKAQAASVVREPTRSKNERFRKSKPLSASTSMFLNDMSNSGTSSTHLSSGSHTPTSGFTKRTSQRQQFSHSRNGSLSSSTETFRPGKSKITTPPMTNQSIIPDDIAIRLVNGISEVISQLESRLNIAEAKSWTLLVCCIGAELTSFYKARDMLSEAANRPSQLQSSTEMPQNQSLKTDGTTDLDTTGNTNVHQSVSSLLQQEFISSSSREHTSSSGTDEEIDDPSALFGTEEPSSPMKPTRFSRLKKQSPSNSEEGDELEYAPFASVHQSAPLVASPGDNVGHSRENQSALLEGEHGMWSQQSYQHQSIYKPAVSASDVSPEHLELMSSPHSAFPIRRDVDDSDVEVDPNSFLVEGENPNA